MYLHIGGETVLQTDKIIGLFDFDGATRQKGTRDFLDRRDGDGRLHQVRGDALPRTFALTEDDRVYLSPISTETLYKRLEKRA
jgi:hypothetical protein